MPKRLLIANRGEIAIRIARTAADLGVETVAVYASDDAASLHVRAADAAVDLGKTGVPAYLDIEGLVAVATAAGCDAVHPGYGFLSENAGFAEACEAAGLVFVGPRPESLRIFGDKAAARALAETCGVPLLAGISRPVSLEEAQAFMAGLGAGGAIMLKAVAGGGGRGMRPVSDPAALAAAFERAASEAKTAFGSGDLYVEELMPRARHVEVQVLGDGEGGVIHLWDRECSLQRQRQKVIEIAPAFGLPDALRRDMLEASVALARAAGYRGLGTIEFLVDASPGAAPRFAFIEANARLQVEHTVTEMVLGLDLVEQQLRIADGARLADLGLADGAPAPQGVAIQARVNLETMTADGGSRPSGGVLAAYDPPSGPGVRVDGYGYAGYATSARYDSLLAKVITHGRDLTAATARARRALSEFKIAGAKTNIGFLQALLASDALPSGTLHTRYVEEHAETLLATEEDRARYFEPAGGGAVRKAGAKIDLVDPLAVLSVKPGEGGVAAAPEAAAPREAAQGPAGTVPVLTPLQGLVLSLAVSPGDTVRAGQPVAVMEALKMEHVIASDVSGIVREVTLEAGDTVFEDTPILFVEPGEVEGDYVGARAPDPDEIRPDLAEVQRLHFLASDAGRPQAVERRRAHNRRTARENVADLCDPDTFIEYGPLVTSGRMRSDTPEVLEERLVRTSADGMVIGVGQVNGDRFGPDRSRCAVVAYDYTVLAGTQGTKSHQKTDRMLRVAQHSKLPVVLFSEGGGGRTGGGSGPPIGSSGVTSLGGLSTRTWRELGKLSGLVPIVGVNAGYCFAGNVVLLGACDVIIATKDSSMGIGGPAMIEGGGLGAYSPDEVGPVSIQEPNGVIDLLAEDEAEAVALAKAYLSYFQGPLSDWTAHDQRPLRHIIPENRRAVYDIRKVIETLADAGSMLELRPRWATSMITALIRIEGRTVGVIANNCNSTSGGAIESVGADKASRFLQLCDAFDIPILSLIDTPGNMVGPEAEKTALIRHCARMYVAGANITVPVFNIVLRKAYGLGAIAMAAGSFDETFFSVAWPTGEFAGMGLEGQIKLGRRAELQAIEDIPARRALYDKWVAEAYNWARAVNAGTVFEVDDVIDPADSRKWMAMGLRANPQPSRTEKKRAWIDTW
ncbi:MAG: carbamoyl-phosphate synthase large subunit [Phenylobacterium sp.]|uniref:carboxyl transferase domain-containing protein n=4 Tax=Phenylobacterium sp. TaxID=1871053 RepID=UPI0025FB7CF6|nr:carboxyl transferase domain-containing protein [Phenylobacterium sp.]MCA6231273.1 carbamoyl-phosphate synthase large subunit [Phenylobacterium sp.]MCA6250360.1 carbamoyl-phosphate synthase large subunit [Phenylobacterium sp.]MCA6257550.1 carbamoyl-phosphate synthase large subunit [Phenylobacterium sp.]MCA6262212.1 carbamoyl-phosphate synthase large subunit [Phenylobacterium sp.]MCA6265710.1 carbamoyl-phosphate synthase large subunit [Phenylobacterium sp.]